MPQYSNNSNRQIGKNFLKIPIGDTAFKSIYYYEDSDLTLIESEPFYNPIKFKEIINFNDTTTYIVELPYEFLEEGHLVVYTKCNNTTKFDIIEMGFNNINNLPSLPLTNSEFEMPIFNRIKRLFFKINEISNGQICVMIVDKYIPSKSMLNIPSNPE